MTNTAYIECKGCQREFTRSGYARHTTMTRNLRCRYIQASSMTQPACQTIGYMVAPLNSLTPSNSNAVPDDDGAAMSIEEDNSLIQPQADG